MNTVNDIPRRLGDRYEVGEVLGRGGMAEVHLSRDSRLGRLVAVKMLRPDLARDPVFQARFRREAQSAAGLNHPAVVAVYDTGEDVFAEPGGATARLPYIVMEYVEGKTGKELLQEAGGGYATEGSATGTGLGTERAVEITAGVLTALDYSHRQGIIHRDIKPANVMITPDGQVKVMDFGIARALADTSATMTQTSAVIGTAQYLSPEQARGETVDARTDLYSTGCLLYELLTGRPPFVGDSPVSVAYQHVREIPTPPSHLNPAVPDALDRVVMKALAKDREDRYASAEEFRRDLLAAAGGHAVGAPAVGAAAAMATQALPSATEATQALAAAGLAGAGGAAVGAAASDGYTGATRRFEPAGPGTLVGGTAGAGVAGGSTSAVRERYEEPPKRRTGAVVGIVLAVLAALALLAVVLFNIFGGSRAPEAPTAVAVPTVTGLSAAEATARLEADGFTVVERPGPSDAEAGTVVDQDPDGGREVAPGTEVAIGVSSGPAAIAVPDVVGDTEAQARDALRAAGLVGGEVTLEPSAEVPEGRVVRTDPGPGTELARNTAVGLVVSTGQQVLEEYAGQDALEAQAALLGAGYDVDVVPEASDEVAEGAVIRTDPPAGNVEPGSTITLFVSSGPAETAEPTESPSESSDGEGGGEEEPSESESPTSSPTTAAGQEQDEGGDEDEG